MWRPARSALLVLMALAPLSRAMAAPSATRVRVDPVRAAAAAEVDARFVSFAVDVDQLVGGTFWDPGGGLFEVRVPPYDFARPRLRNLTEPLAPAYLRLGGSASDQTFYDLGDSPVAAAPPPFQEVLTRVQWDGAMDFATDLGLDVVLTVNAGAGPRDGGGAWTPANARTLLEYAASRSDPVAVLEFGNEPNLFALRASLPGYDAVRYAAELATFRALRDDVLPAALIGGPGNIVTRTQGEDVLPGLIFGPRQTEMLPLAGALLDIVEYHYYAAISTRCPLGVRVTPDTALDPAYLDGIDEPTAAITPLRDAYAPGRPIWLTESGGQSCGGQIGVGDRFLNSFWYLNTLGRMARSGQRVFVRQTLSGSTYGLIDDVTLTPRPDYWAALLWRRLMGTRVLALRRPAPRDDVRLFAHCQRDGAPGAVTVLALNTSRTRSARVRVRRARGRQPAQQWLVTAADPAASTLFVNGVEPAVSADGTPALPPGEPMRGAVVLPPVSYAFVTVPDAWNAACR